MTGEPKQTGLPEGLPEKDYSPEYVEAARGNVALTRGKIHNQDEVDLIKRKPEINPKIPAIRVKVKIVQLGEGGNERGRFPFSVLYHWEPYTGKTVIGSWPVEMAPNGELYEQPEGDKEPDPNELPVALLLPREQELPTETVAAVEVQPEQPATGGLSRLLPWRKNK